MPEANSCDMYYSETNITVYTIAFISGYNISPSLVRYELYCANQRICRHICYTLTACISDTGVAPPGSCFGCTSVGGCVLDVAHTLLVGQILRVQIHCRCDAITSPENNSLLNY